MREHTLHLLVPGLLGPMPALARSGLRPELPRLSRCLARADRLPAPGRDLESTLFGLSGLAPPPGRDLPVAAFQRVGEGAAPDERPWMLAHPVFLRPDRSRLLLFDFQDLTLSPEEARDLAGLLEEHFREQDWHLELAEPFRWYLSPDRAPAIQTFGLGEVFGRNIAAFLPRGDEALVWHGLLNEAQMLLFGCETNRAREVAGRLPVNGLWVSGAGRLPERFVFPYDRLFADHPLPRGMARVGGVVPAPLADWEPENGEGRALLVDDRLLRPVWRADPYDWTEALAAFDAWLAGPLRALSEKRLERLDIYPCNGARYRLDRRALRRFWRRAGDHGSRLDPDPVLQRI